MVAGLCSEPGSNTESARGATVKRAGTIKALKRIHPRVFFFTLTNSLSVDKRYFLECTDLSALWSAATCRSLRRKRRTGEKRRQVAALQKKFTSSAPWRSIGLVTGHAGHPRGADA